MKMNRSDLLVSDLCEEIDWLKDELEKVQKDAKLWRDRYSDLVDSDIKHGEKMMENILTLVLTKNITPVRRKEIA